MDSQGSRSVFSAATAGIFLDADFQRDVDSGFKGIDASQKARKDIYGQLQDRYRCQHCDVVIAETDTYIHHLAQHCNAMPFLCNLRGCTKRFNLQFELKEHTIFHKALLANRKLPVGEKSEIFTSYIRSVQRLKQIQETMHQSSRRSIEAQYNRIVAEKADKGHSWRLVRDMRTNEIALKAIELLNLEKVDNLWRKACALRWRCCHEKILPPSWMTEREIHECQFVKDHNDRSPWDMAMDQQTGDQLKRRHSFS